jgi:hypothetical protein
MIDPPEILAALHRAELEAVAAEYRLARAVRPTTGPSPLARLYMRIWWASRPRAAHWAPRLLDPSY